MKGNRKRLQKTLLWSVFRTVLLGVEDAGQGLVQSKLRTIGEDSVMEKLEAGWLPEEELGVDHGRFVHEEHLKRELLLVLEDEAVDGLSTVAGELPDPVGGDAGDRAAHDLLFRVPDREKVEEGPGHRALARAGVAAEKEGPGGPVHDAYGLPLLVTEHDTHLLLLVVYIAFDVLKDGPGELATPQGECGVYPLLRIIEERGGELLILEKDDPVVCDHVAEDRLKELGVDRVSLR